MTASTSINRRRQLVQGQAVLNGVDYVEVVTPPAGNPATQLRVVFVNPLGSIPAPTQIRVVGGDRIPSVPVQAVDLTDDPATILVTLAGPGDFSTYTLEMVGGATNSAPPAWIDPVLNSACFTFSLDCMSDLPCVDQQACPPAAIVEPQLDYLARDWESLCALLLDRMSVLQPNWTQRNAADVRMTLIELLAELGDRVSYKQDAITTEAYLGTARRRISAGRHARLVDYAMGDGTNARTWVQFSLPDDVRLVSDDKVPVIPVGTRLLTGNPDAPCLIPAGSAAEINARRAGAIEFQALDSLSVVVGRHSSMHFYTWSGSRPALPIGATSATLAGHLPDLARGQVLILMENRDPDGPQKAVADADPSRRQAVRLTGVVALDGDSPLRDELTGDEITEVTWHNGDALAFPLLIEGEITTERDGTEIFTDGALALGNVVLADHGQREVPAQFGPVPVSGPVTFSFPKGPLTQVARRMIAVSLPDQSGTEQVLVPFDSSDSAASALTAPADAVLPDVTLLDCDGGEWRVQRDLISSGTNRDVVIEVDDDNIGWLRFGRIDDGLPINGQPPDPGHVIKASYRTGNGVIGNIGVGAIKSVLDDDSIASIAASLREVLTRPGATATVTNPLPAQGGTEPETIEQIRQRAPFAFRRQERAVTAEDYADRAAQFGSPGPARIQQAMATIRWTGSWYTVVVAIDPIGSETVDATFLAQVQDYLDGYRMAGHEVQVVAAQYAPLEVGLAVYVDPAYRRDLVRAELLAVMSNRRLPDGRLGLFYPDRLTFGAAVYLGPIIAAAQAIAGVARVTPTRFSRYRQPGTDARTSGRIEIGPSEIARLDNDPSRPELGRFYLDDLEGGR
jgi:Baseplate J-like protein